MKIIWLVALATTIASPAMAQEIPQFDIHAHCKKIATLGDAYSATLDKACLDMEQSAFAKLKSTWPTASSHLRANCTDDAEFGGPGSYALLGTCIEMGASATGSKKQAFKSGRTESQSSARAPHTTIPGG